MKKNNKLELLYEASLQIFAKYGYKKTTVEDIASKLGVTKGNIYFYVKNKEDLYHKTVTFELLKWKSYVQSGIENEENHEKKFTLLAELAVEYINNTVNSSEDRFYKVNREALALLKNVLADGVNAGVFVVRNIDYISHLIYSVYIMFLIQTYAKPQNVSSGILFREGLALVLRGILVR